MNPYAECATVGASIGKPTHGRIRLAVLLGLAVLSPNPVAAQAPGLAGAGTPLFRLKPTPPVIKGTFDW